MSSFALSQTRKTIYENLHRIIGDAFSSVERSRKERMSLVASSSSSSSLSSLTTAIGVGDDVMAMAASRLAAVEARMPSTSDDKLPLWKEDEELQRRLTQMKQASEILSHNCNKMNLLAKDRNDDIIQSIADEVIKHVGVFTATYFGVIGDGMVAYPLFLLISESALCLLSNVRELVNVFSSGDLQPAATTTGVILKMSVDIQRLPVSNKAAYRRSIMGNVMSMNDTVREFVEYVETYTRRQAQVGVGENDDDQIKEKDGDSENGSEMYDDDDYDGGSYDEEEVPVVKRSIVLMEVAVQITKLALGAMTHVADTLPSHDENARNLWLWINALKHQCASIETNVINLGSELYSPIDTSNVEAATKNLLADLRVTTHFCECGLPTLGWIESVGVMTSNTLEEIQTVKQKLEHFMT